MPLKFLYLVQSPAELPAPFRSVRANTILGSFEQHTGNTDVYIPRTTWSSGRNRLVQAVVDSGVNFDYLVLADGDVEFELGALGFTKFEEVVSRYMPAVATPRLGLYNRVGSNIAGLPSEIQRQGLEDVARHVQAVDWFDGCFNAFRHDVVQQSVLLPYVEKYDHESWWISQFLLILNANLHYRGQVLQANQIEVLNTKSSEYPRGTARFAEAFQDWKRLNGVRHLKMTSSAAWKGNSQPSADKS